MNEKPRESKTDIAGDTSSRDSLPVDTKESVQQVEHQPTPVLLDENEHKHRRSREQAHIQALALAPGVTRETFAHLDEKKILRKMDIRLLPMLALLYLLSFLDRGNIGNAKVSTTARLRVWCWRMQ